jgi:hypothetical protein
MAARRFGFAVARRRPDDELVDLIIAAEALLLDDNERDEKRFQVSLRLALSTEVAEATQRQVFRFIKRAYDVRSAIIHGGEPRPRDLKGLDGMPVDLGTFAAQVEDVIRALLRQAMVRINRGALVCDWESGVFGSS